MQKSQCKSERQLCEMLDLKPGAYYCGRKKNAPSGALCSQ